MDAALPLAPTPAGPRGLPLLGSLLDLARDPLDFLIQTSRTWGDLSTYTVGFERHWLVNHPDGIETVFVGLRDATRKDDITRGLSRLLGQGLLTSEDPLWRRQRKLVAPSFQPRHLATYAQTMADAAREAPLVDGPRDIHHDMTVITLQIVLRTLFGADDTDGAKVGEALGSFMDAFEQELRSFRRMLPPWVPTRGRARITAARRQIEQTLDPIVAARRASGAESDDLLGRLLAARDEDGQGMSDAQLRDEAVTLFLAGHETTALALSYALWLLADRPDIQQALAREREAIGPDGLTSATASRLALHDAVIREAMRLYPPAWLTGRTPLRDVEVLGHRIPEGDQILLPQWTVHRDERWWREPLAFRPERWLGDETRNLPRFAYFPFGGGPRVCVGNHFAALEAVLVLATWLDRRQLAPVPGAELSLMPAVTLRPRTGVMIDVRCRPTDRPLQ